jgi:putative acetyltransferase
MVRGVDGSPASAGRHRVSPLDAADRGVTMSGVRNGAATRSFSSLGVRAVVFEDVPEILRLIGRAVERGCRDHYDPTQRAAVCAGYAQHLFIEAVGPFEMIAAVQADLLLGVAQLDSPAGHLRGLFVDGDLQRRGVGRLLLAEVERRALRSGARRLHGAMSLNAVPFYTRAGFRPCPGPDRLIAAAVSVPVLRMEKALRP